ncbi:hypothetical protein E3A20_02470 [Planctomyces bekefii]|uniref:BAAT/Acyl-CoA thioester hydrolase C-terminal domain-containing protein n=1 Tax=Planctomyces bekefii TaxID=1653850 RepID=A0A5C6MD06_9PLAN|nr:hypothetical protein E3A20_02470 [Planctomyces bekefii]
MEIPLEGSIAAVEWLSTHPLVQGQKVGLFGFSRGGEQAAAVASVVGDSSPIAAIAAGAPADYNIGAFFLG